MKQLFFLFVCALTVACGSSSSPRLPDGWYHIDNTLEDSIVRPAIMTTDQIADIQLDSMLYAGGMTYLVNIRIIEKKQKDFADATEKAIGRQIAFVYKGKIMNAPTVTGRIEGGRVSITALGKEDAIELYNSIVKNITHEPENLEPPAPRDSSKLYFDEIARFDSLLNAWKRAWRTNPTMMASSNTNDARKLEQYPLLFGVGKKALPLLLPELAQPDNFFMLTLYDDLQDNERLKCTDTGKGEQFRAQESVRKYVEDRLGIKKRVFANNREKLSAMKEMYEKHGSSFENTSWTKQQIDSILLIMDYDIMEAIITDKWFDEFGE